VDVSGLLNQVFRMSSHTCQIWRIKKVVECPKVLNRFRSFGARLLVQKSFIAERNASCLASPSNTRLRDVRREGRRPGGRLMNVSSPQDFCETIPKMLITGKLRGSFLCMRPI
jgi:hypothetical protein